MKARGCQHRPLPSSGFALRGTLASVAASGCPPSIHCQPTIQVHRRRRGTNPLRAPLRRCLPSAPASALGRPNEGSRPYQRRGACLPLRSNTGRGRADRSGAMTCDCDEDATRFRGGRCRFLMKLIKRRNSRLYCRPLTHLLLLSKLAAAGDVGPEKAAQPASPGSQPAACRREGGRPDGKRRAGWCAKVSGWWVD